MGLAYVLPCRRFADTLADANARLGADAVRYSFIAVDFHHLLFAGLFRRTENQNFCNTPRLVILALMRFWSDIIATVRRCFSCQKVSLCPEGHPI